MKEQRNLLWERSEDIMLREAYPRSATTDVENPYSAVSKTGDPLRSPHVNTHKRK